MSFNALVEQLWQIREERRDLAKRDKELMAQYDELKTSIIARLNDLGIDSAKTPVARVTITESQVVNPTDWDAFYQYIKDTDSFHLLQKRFATNACKELATLTNEPIPGIEFKTLHDLTLTSNKGTL